MQGVESHVIGTAFLDPRNGGAAQLSSLPARLNATEAAVLLGFKEHDIAPLVAAKFLMPLGKPAQNSPKYFAAVEITARAYDRGWLSEATKALARRWSAKNSRKTKSAGGSP
jgi:hypothetical protein